MQSNTDSQGKRYPKKQCQKCKLLSRTPPWTLMVFWSYGVIPLHSWPFSRGSLRSCLRLCLCVSYSPTCKFWMPSRNKEVVPTSACLNNSADARGTLWKTEPWCGQLSCCLGTLPSTVLLGTRLSYREQNNLDALFQNVFFLLLCSAFLCCCLLQLSKSSLALALGIKAFIPLLEWCVARRAVIRC